MLKWRLILQVYNAASVYRPYLADNDEVLENTISENFESS